MVTITGNVDKNRRFYSKQGKTDEVYLFRVPQILKSLVRLIR